LHAKGSINKRAIARQHGVFYVVCIGEEHSELPRDLLGGRSFLVHLTAAVLRSCTALRHTTPATTGTTDIWEKLADPCAAASVTTRNSEMRSVSTDSQFN
jgi:hypothetical protein